MKVTKHEIFNKKHELLIDVLEDYIEVEYYQLGKPNLAGLQKRKHIETFKVAKTAETVDKLTRFASVTHALKLIEANIYVEPVKAKKANVSVATPKKTVTKKATVYSLTFRTPKQINKPNKAVKTSCSRPPEHVQNTSIARIGPWGGDPYLYSGSPASLPDNLE